MPEPVVGNIYTLLAAAAVVGMKKLLAWSFPILTKLTAGVGLLWFAVCGEGWRVLQAAGGLSLIVVVSCHLDPRQWHAWVRLLFGHRNGTPDSQTSFLLRCLPALGLVAIGARKPWCWLIAPARAWPARPSGTSYRLRCRQPSPGLPGCRGRTWSAPS